jgi:amidase
MRGPEVPRRVAVCADPGGLGVHPDVAAGVARAADALRDAGYDVEEVELPAIELARNTWDDLVMAELRLTLAPLLQPIASEGALRFLDHAFQRRPELDYLGYIGGFAARSAVARAWTDFHSRYPLVLGPVATIQPFPVGHDLAGPAEVAEILNGLRLVVLANLIGLPVAVVSTGVANGLPQGVQIVGDRYREDLCLDAAEAIEERLGVVTPIDPK